MSKVPGKFYFFLNVWNLIFFTAFCLVMLINLSCKEDYYLVQGTTKELQICKGLLGEINQLLISVGEPKIKSLDVYFFRTTRELLGQGVSYRNEIYLNKEIMDDIILKHVFFHEVLHSVYGVKHDEHNLLMQPQIPNRNLSSKDLDSLFLDYTHYNKKHLNKLKIW